MSEEFLGQLGIKGDVMVFELEGIEYAGQRRSGSDKVSDRKYVQKEEYRFIEVSFGFYYSQYGFIFYYSYQIF